MNEREKNIPITVEFDPRETTSEVIHSLDKKKGSTHAERVVSTFIHDSIKGKKKKKHTSPFIKVDKRKVKPIRYDLNNIKNRKFLENLEREFIKNPEKEPVVLFDGNSPTIRILSDRLYRELIEYAKIGISIKRDLGEKVIKDEQERFN